MSFKKHNEGDLYDVISAGGITFEIRYGYYEEFERESWEPIPIFPDLKTNPIYTSDGQPVVTQMQDICECYSRKEDHTDDDSCSDCIYFLNKDKKPIGVCTNKYKKLIVEK